MNFSQAQVKNEQLTNEPLINEQLINEQLTSEGFIESELSPEDLKQIVGGEIAVDIAGVSLDI